MQWRDIRQLQLVSGEGALVWKGGSDQGERIRCRLRCLSQALRPSPGVGIAPALRIFAIWFVGNDFVTRHTAM